jgi:hypothetical protein
VIWCVSDPELLHAVKSGQHGADVKLKLLIRNQYGTSETKYLALNERVHEFDATAGFSYSLQSTLVRRDGRVVRIHKTEMGVEKFLEKTQTGLIRL